MDNVTVDQSVLAEDVSKMVPYEFTDTYLVKPLDPIKVKKEVPVPVVKEEKKDENGIEAQDFDEVKTEVKEFDSDFRKGIILKVPLSMQNTQDTHTYKFNVGDTVVFRDRAGIHFDLVKDSKLIKYYDIVGIAK